MLYCPKCGSTYQEGTQRFCTNDGGRLLPSPSANKSTTNTQGVFTNILGRSSSKNENDEKLSQNPRFTPTAPKPPEKPNFQTSFSSKIFKDENPPVKKEEKPIQAQKPVVRLIKPEEVHSGTADVGDRKSNPTGRLALSKQNPKALYGQTIKGRYYITELLSEDSSSLVYLADDKIIAYKQVIFRVLLNEKNDDFLSKILAEERVSLSHINHPNVASVIDSGELLEGFPFVITEYLDGFSVEEKLSIVDNFNPMRTARIIRQASYALSEVHQNGILHRGLNPSNIFLTVSEAGTEQVKVTDFVVANTVNRQKFETVKYLAPEQLEGKLPNFASDIYSLGVIAFQMLTGRQPFNVSTADQLLRAQREGIKIGPSNLRLDLSPVVDEVLEKALAYVPSERYPKARDFGDALYNALTTPATYTKPAEAAPLALKKEEKEAPVAEPVATPVLKEETPPVKENRITIEAKKESISEIPVVKAPEAAPVPDVKKAKPGSELAWEKRSPEPVKATSFSWKIIAGLGGVLLVAGIIGWLYFWSRPSQSVVVPKPENAANQNSGQPRNNPISDPNTANINAPTPFEIDSPPAPRSVPQPPNTEYFQTSKLEAKGELSKNYRGFSLYYPKTWTRNPSETNFVDISKKTEDGLPVEQFLVTYYDSNGTYKLDAEKFPNLVKESGKKLGKQIANFKIISEGETRVNTDWKAYQMKFQGAVTTKTGENVTIWGRCLYIPAARQGVKSGFLITMVAYSLSPDVKSVDEVGIKGELGSILETFEPSTLD